MVAEKKNKLDQIFDATLVLTGKVGIAGLKMADIAKEAGIASGTLYIYFKSKEALVNALYVKLQKEGASAITSQIQHLPVNIQLYKMWRTAFKSLVSNPMRMIFLEQFVVSPFITRANKDADAAFKDYLNALLNKGKQEELIVETDNTILISLIMGFIRNYSMHLIQHKNNKPIEEAIDESFSICWKAIAK